MAEEGETEEGETVHTNSMAVSMGKMFWISNLTFIHYCMGYMHDFGLILKLKKPRIYCKCKNIQKLICIGHNIGLYFMVTKNEMSNQKTPHLKIKNPFCNLPFKNVG